MKENLLGFVVHEWVGRIETERDREREEREAQLINENEIEY